jgi:hypothetical protein
VGERAGAVEDPDVRRISVEEPLPSVEVEPQVAGDGLVESVQEVHDEAHHGDDTDEWVPRGEASEQARAPTRLGRRV